MQTDTLHRYQVGELYHESRKSWPEGSQFNYRGGGAELLLLYDHPTDKELQDVRKGNAQFAILPYRSVLFLLFRFGDGGWSDAPFAWWMVPEDQRILPPTDLTPESRSLLNVILVGADDGLIKVLRLVTLSPHFTREMFACIHRQAGSKWEGIAAHDRHIGGAYSRWQTQARMVKDAISKCASGD